MLVVGNPRGFKGKRNVANGTLLLLQFSLYFKVRQSPTVFIVARFRTSCGYGYIYGERTWINRPAFSEFSTWHRFPPGILLFRTQYAQ
jgi:hypothetical protein